MESFSDLALSASMFFVLAWLHCHPTQRQRAKAQRTQELRDWDWSA